MPTINCDHRHLNLWVNTRPERKRRRRGLKDKLNSRREEEIKQLKQAGKNKSIRASVIKKNQPEGRRVGRVAAPLHTNKCTITGGKGEEDWGVGQRYTYSVKHLDVVGEKKGQVWKGNSSNTLIRA